MKTEKGKRGKGAERGRSPSARMGNVQRSTSNAQRPKKVRAKRDVAVVFLNGFVDALASVRALQDGLEHLEEIVGRLLSRLADRDVLAREVNRLSAEAKTRAEALKAGDRVRVAGYVEAATVKSIGLQTTTVEVPTGLGVLDLTVPNSHVTRL